jgi:hypothetical protein
VTLVSPDVELSEPVSTSINPTRDARNRRSERSRGSGRLCRHRCTYQPFLDHERGRPRIRYPLPDRC